MPSVSIISTGFLKQAEVVAKGLGLPEMAIAEFPGVPMVKSTEEFRAQVVSHVLPKIIEGLSKPISRSEPARETLTPQPRDIVFSGDFDAVQEYFHEQNWSDGMPVVPPTIDRIDLS